MRKPLRHLKTSTRKSGYTLTEMLVVIAVIGLIAAFITPNLLNQLSRSRAKAAELHVQSVAAAVTLFRDDVGRYPTEAEGLAALVREPVNSEGWTGPYLEGMSALSDPWGSPLAYMLDAERNRYAVRSLGADGREGGRGVDRDLTAPEAQP
jgi:general secretion pathway protein G